MSTEPILPGPGQTALFGDTLDAAGSRAAARAGAELADENAADGWPAAALDVFHWCARTYPDFTTDQFWAEMTSRGVAETSERRAVAAVVGRAVGRGWIERTGTYRTSERRQAHSGPKAVYRSMIWARR